MSSRPATVKPVPLEHRVGALEERVTRLEARFGDIRDSIGSLADCNAAIVRGLAKLNESLSTQEPRIIEAVSSAIRGDLLALRKEIRTVPCRMEEKACEASDAAALMPKEA